MSKRTFATSTIIGYLGHEPQLRYTQNETAVVNLSLAVHEGQNGQSQTHWHKATVWGRQAEAINKHMRKGALLLVSGSLKTSKFTNSRGGTRVVTYVDANTVEFMDPPKNNSNTNQRSNQAQSQDQSSPEPAPVFPVS